ncbi:arginase family-domain-containing protein [Thelonectria olida]|uniref:Arginase family-domain-containing protein n=1 Tax=Thelonectria olida TaxID=1576542 RepID=A0A9P8W0C3_9HYPO|nr:arginase family-domain-containing protein [Thelonectria olida]
MKHISLLFLSLVQLLVPLGAHGCGHDGNARDWTKEELDELERKWGRDWAFTGISTFAHLKHERCLTTPSELYDIAIIGAPFDTAVSYRPGARFGPRAIRAASARQSSGYRGFNQRAGINPFVSWAKILDCGDIPITPMDNEVALRQMTAALTELNQRPALSTLSPRPRLITLGGDHSIALPALRALRETHGQPIRVLHFDAHLDTWHPAAFPSAWESTQSHFNHGSMFWMAGNEGLIANDSSRPSLHAGLRTRLAGIELPSPDYQDDDSQNWIRISSDDMDDMGADAIAQKIMSTFGTEELVYLSVDIDVLDPAFAPGTGTPEPGGWTTRELVRVLRGIEGLNLVGADIVEVSPSYDGRGEETALAAAQVVYEIMTSMVKKGMDSMGKHGDGQGKHPLAKDEL